MARAQVTASFAAPDTVCVNSPVTVTNTSTGAGSYFWNFCVSDINTIPQQAALGNPGNTLSVPAYMDYVIQNGNYYAFIINNSPGALIRLDFGNSLLNTPTSTNLGNFGGIISNSAQGIQIVQNNGRWYAIVVTGDPQTIPATASRILKVDFGPDVTNSTPVATNWGNIGSMNYPHDLFLFQDAAQNWYGFTVSYRNSTITKFSFGPDFNNPPTGVNMGNIGGLDGPTGICPVNDNGTWRVFVTSFNSNSISRIDFGNSLLNAPTNSVNLGNPGGFLNPRDLYIFNFCGQSVGFVANNNAGMIRLNFNGLTAVPTATPIGSITGAANIHSISKVFRVQEDVFAFLPSSNSSNLTRIRFPGCTSVSAPNSSQASPPSVTYTTPGTYNINLTIDDGLPTQATFCKQVVVINKPTISKSADVVICQGDSAQILVTGGDSYVWTPASGLSGSNIGNPKAAPGASTKYYVDVTKGACAARDSVSVSVLQPGVLQLSPLSASICMGDSVRLTASGADMYEWLLNAQGTNPTTVDLLVTPTVTTQYAVKVSTNTCNLTDTLFTTVTVKPLPSVSVRKSGDLDCATNEVQLFASGGQQYVWTPVAGLSSANIADPKVRITQNTTYTVKATAANGCVAYDTIPVLVLATGATPYTYSIPSAFTPNNDGKNDCFGIGRWGGVNELDFRIYNRWGEVIFAATTPSSCWNGNLKGIPQPAGTYIYKIKANTNCGLVEKYGTFVLIR